MKEIEVAVAVIIRKNNILLTQRFDPSNPEIHLKWQLPGGKIEKGETAFDACTREALEETGLNIKLLSKNPVVIKNFFPNVIYVLNGFKAQVISGTIDVEKDYETADCRWFTQKEIKGLDLINNTLEMIGKCLI